VKTLVIIFVTVPENPDMDPDMDVRIKEVNAVFDKSGQVCPDSYDEEGKVWNKGHNKGNGVLNTNV
jgi:hypothetical protein